MAVTVITKKRGRPLVTGDVGVSIINWTGRKAVKANQVKTNCMHTEKEKKRKKKHGSYDNMDLLVRKRASAIVTRARSGD